MVNHVRLEDRLDGASNFSSWKIRVLIILREMELENYIETNTPMPENESEKTTWKRHNNKAMKIIIDSVKDHILPSIANLKTAFDMFSTIQSTFEINNTSRLLTLKQDLLYIKMKNGESITSYFLRITELKDQLATMQNQIDDKELSMIALRGLPLSWETFIRGLSSRPELPKFDQLKNECTQEESRLASRGLNSNQDNDIQALYSKSNKKRKFNHNKKGNNKNNKSHKNRDWSKVRCFKCDKLGHSYYACPEKQKIQAALAEVKIENNEKTDKENYAFIVALSSELNSNHSTWILDSGASRHISGFKDKFDTLSNHEAEEVTIGDNSSYPIKGIGTCSIQLNSDITLQLKNVLYVPGIKRNLVSISGLADQGYHIAFQGNKVLSWTRNSSIKKAITIGVRDGSLYKLCNSQNPELNLTLSKNMSNSIEIWHRRLGHLNFRALASISKIVKGLPNLNSDHSSICKGCALGKNTKHSFPNSVHKSKNILELIHTDLCGPMSVPSLNGCQFYVIFIDDYSRRTWIYFLKTKESSEVLSKFKEFKALVENQSGQKIKTLRSDNGGEFTSDIFKNFCISVGIKREYSVPYNPQQNGIAERKNRSIVESARAMLHDQNLHYSFWAEASNTAVYIQNRCPHSILENITPEEAFTKVKPDLSHLRIFGCPVYIHVPKERRTKLEPSGKKGIFIGYSETSKGYRIYIPGQRTIEVSRDVIFEEDTAFKISNNDECISEEDQETEIEREDNSDISSMSNNNESDHVNLNNKKRPLWARKMLAENQVEPDDVIQESKRTRNQSCYVALLSELIKSEPTNVKEALSHQSWKEAMIEEYNSILKNDVWDIVPRPKNKSVVSSKWLFKIKHAADGSIEKYKARFVARGFSQKEGIDYDETFAPVARYTSVRTILAIAASKGWKVHQMDVKTAFLNGKIEEEVYVEQPEGFSVFDRQTHVCKLKKALYGLKQAPRAWYERIDTYLLKLGFAKNEADPNLYFKTEEDDMVIFVLYVDDLLITGDEHMIEKCKQDLSAEFEMKDLGLLHYFLGLEI